MKPTAQATTTAALILTLLVIPGQAWSTKSSPAASIGLRAGPLLSITELEDDPGPAATAFVRRGLSRRLEGELSIGYGRFQGTDYSSDLRLGELRLLYSPYRSGRWNAHLFAGFGATHYDLDEIPDLGDFPLPAPHSPETGWGLTLPVGAGISRKLSDLMLLELSGNFTYTMLDDLNSVILKKGNDLYWTLMVGLVFSDFGGGAEIDHTTIEMPELIRPQPPKDTDGDTLYDAEETAVYGTDPLSPDTDQDRLDDGAEVKRHKTDPLNPDTDGGSVIDGEEVERGTDPLDPKDDVEEIILPTILFAFNSVDLSAEARQQLDLAAEWLGINGEILLEIQGHTDYMGSDTYNKRLAGLRSQAVRDYLVQQGVKSWRLRIKIFGESKQAIPGETDAARKKNRRVELIQVGME
jgi:outer membrane protein OmpA-like peptidoglycan-associated protein